MIRVDLEHVGYYKGFRVDLVGDSLFVVKKDEDREYGMAFGGLLQLMWSITCSDLNATGRFVFKEENNAK